MPMMIQSVCLVYLYRFVRVRAELELKARTAVVAREKITIFHAFASVQLRIQFPSPIHAEWCN
jgi:D-aminopeptidase